MKKLRIICTLTIWLYATIIQSMAEGITTKPATAHEVHPRMTENATMADYVASLKTKFPDAQDHMLANHIKTVLSNARNTTPTLAWAFGGERSKLTPEEVTNYNIDLNLSNPETTSFITLTEHNNSMASARQSQINASEPNKNSSMQEIQDATSQPIDTSLSLVPVKSQVNQQSTRNENMNLAEQQAPTINLGQSWKSYLATPWFKNQSTAQQPAKITNAREYISSAKKLVEHDTPASMPTQTIRATTRSATPQTIQQNTLRNKQQQMVSIKDVERNQETIEPNKELVTTETLQPKNNLQMVVYQPQENRQALLARSKQQPTKSNTITPQTAERQLKEINNTKNLELVTYDPQQRTQYKPTTEPAILNKDAAIESRSDAHQKNIDKIKIEIETLQDEIAQDQAAKLNQPKVTKTIREKLSDLWNNAKIPTAAEIKNALNAIFTKIQDTFLITISDPIRKTLFKQAVDTLPKDKDPKKIDSWSLSVQKSIYRTTLKFLTSTLDARAKKQLNIDQDIADLPHPTKTAYLSIKYGTYILCFEMYTKLYESVPDIANSLSNAILKDVQADRLLTPKDMDILQSKFIQKFVDWNSSDASQLEQAYKFLEIEPTADEATIKKAYYKLARLKHPDRNNGYNAEFNKVNEAYNLILEKKDTQKNPPQEEMAKKIEQFRSLINDFLVDIYTQQAAIRQAHEPLKNMVIEKLDQSFGLVPDEHDPIIKDLTRSVKELGKYLSNKRAKEKQLDALKIIIENGISKTNPNGTVTFSRKGYWSQETSTITVDKQGNIVNMNNITDKTW